jgi:hypothetical protein
MEQPTNPTNTPNLCINCNWVSIPASREIDRYKCFAPQNTQGVNLVTGDKELYEPKCTVHREYDHESKHLCGKVGNWWQLRPVPTLNPEYRTPAVPASKSTQTTQANMLADLSSGLSDADMEIARQKVAAKLAALKKK